MSLINSSRFRLIFALMLGFFSAAVQAQGFRYKYIPLDNVLPGFTFFPDSILDDGSVYGTATDDSASMGNIAVYKNGTTTILRSGFSSSVNNRGVVGGFVVNDPETFDGQAALFRGSRVTLIPRLPGETFSFVKKLTDSGLALVLSLDDTGATAALYKGNKLKPLDFGRSVDTFDLDINDRGIITGRTCSFCSSARGSGSTHAPVS